MASGFLPNIANTGLVADLAGVQSYALTIGVAALAGGIWLLIQHKRHLVRVLSSDVPERVKAFESRKFRRRALASTLIASLGTMLAALYWINDQRVFASVILIILGLLVGISGLALIDIFSIGLHRLSTPDKTSQKAMIEEFLRNREKEKRESEDDLD